MTTHEKPEPLTVEEVAEFAIWFNTPDGPQPTWMDTTNVDTDINRLLATITHLQSQASEARKRALEEAAQVAKESVLYFKGHAKDAPHDERRRFNMGILASQDIERAIRSLSNTQG